MSAVQTTPTEDHDLGRWEDEGGFVPAQIDIEPEPESPRAARRTYRERRLARAEKLRGWAEKREDRAAAAFDRATELGQQIPFGQPIIVGHYSERGHRAHLARIDSAMRQSCESSAMAARMSESADEIERQARNAIYSDDPDAIQQLTRKIESLERTRADMKAANAAFRAGRRDGALTRYQRNSEDVPYPTWALTNLGATIRTATQRRAKLQREAASGPTFRTITARFASTCAACGGSIEKGAVIKYARTAGAFHTGCEVA